MGENLRAATFMMAAMAAFTINDAFMKGVAGVAPIFQILFLRGLITVFLTFAIAWKLQALRINPTRNDIGFIFLRIMSELIGAFCVLIALAHMQIANVIAILQFLPLAMAVAAFVVLGERISPAQWVTVGTGFLGVMLIIRPTSSDFSTYSGFVIAAVICITLRDLATRRITSDVPSIFVVVCTAMGATLIFGIACLGFSWQNLSFSQGAFVAGAAIATAFGYLFSVLVMRVGRLSFIAPFRYTSLLWALGLGFVFFGDWPSSLELLGAAIVIVSGLVHFRLEVQTMPQLIVSTDHTSGQGK